MELTQGKRKRLLHHGYPLISVVELIELSLFDCSPG